MDQSAARKSPMAHAIDIAINLSIVFLILAWCFQILLPFVSLIAWGGIIAIALYPTYIRLEAAIGGRRKLALGLLIIVAGAIIIVPMWSFTGSLIEGALDLNNRLDAGTLTIRPPNESVRDWPIVGGQIYSVWADASSNLSGFLADHNSQVRNIVRGTLARIAGAGLGALQFFVSFIIAAAFIAGTQAATSASRRLLTRIAGSDGEALRVLSVATIRSIAVGVLGIAVIQALGAGIGIALVGIPAAGLWALIVLVLAIMQLPPWIVLFPMVFYVFSIESTTVAVIFAVWSIIVSFADAVLKPMLLGRGVDAPMIVILLGAIGGMITSGIIGLFVGAVVLGLSYKLLMIWLAAGEPTSTAAPASDVEAHSG